MKIKRKFNPEVGNFRIPVIADIITLSSLPYLADDRLLSWLIELLADDSVEPVLLAVGEGEGGRPA